MQKYMRNILIHALQYSAILGLGMLAFINHALAAPVLIPSSVTSLSDTKATIVSKVFNQVSNNTTVWFEWGNTPTPATVVGLTDIYQQGYFQANLNGLNPGTTYYFRAVAFEGGVTVYSPVVSFTTTGGVFPIAPTQAYMQPVASPVVQPVAPVVVYTQPTAPIQDVTPVVEQKKFSTTQAVKKRVPALVKKEIVPETSPETATNANVASVLGAGKDILPGTLIAWVGLFISILIGVILVRMIIESNEKRKKALEQAKLKNLREAPLTA